jgi:hypothetical protein
MMMSICHGSWEEEEEEGEANKVSFLVFSLFDAGCLSPWVALIINQPAKACINGWNFDERMGNGNRWECPCLPACVLLEIVPA